MEKAIIYYKNSDNIGDDIQTYAALKLVGNPDYFLDREHLNKDLTAPRTRLLCNGWFMKNPKNWPPHPNLIPLFVSLYIDHKHQCHEYMLDEKLKPYYEKFGPIGCRDKHTQQLFQNLNIPSYFSGCVTLTLPRYKGKKSDEILLVDPFVKIFDQKYVDTQINRIIPEKHRSQVTVLTHHDYDLKNLSMEQRMDKAAKLLDRYAKAKLIITSRIHCALPATAMGTPVYFMDVGYDRKHSHERLEGLLDLFEVIDDTYFPVGGNHPWTKMRRKLGLYSKDKIHPNPIDFELKDSTLEKFKGSFTQSQQLGEDIRDAVKDFFEIKTKL
ncbi:hypothetical protein GO491_08950 [Flavobacteriaceae bacterium Ap0902]|nr:hypothetical protein [Flavobacteriaceae bacterium Ap0902]